MNKEVRQKYDIIIDPFIGDFPLLGNDTIFCYHNNREFHPLTSIEFFFEDFFRVVKDGKYGLINAEGYEVIPCMYDYIDTRQIEGDYQSVSPSDHVDEVMQQDDSLQNPSASERTQKSPGHVWVVKLKGKYGLFSTTGQEIYPCVLEEVNYLPEENRLMIRKNQKVSYLLPSGEEVIPDEQDHAEVFVNGLAKVAKKGKYGFINQKGDICVPAIYEYATDFQECLTKQVALVRRNEKWGIIDSDGHEIIPCHFDKINTLPDCVELGSELETVGDMPFFSLVWVQNNGLWGLYDIEYSNPQITPCMYEKFLCFVHDFAPVKKDGKWGFINMGGAEILSYQYDEVEQGKYAFHPFLVRKDGKYGLINEVCVEVIPCMYDHIQIGQWDYVHRLLKVQREGLLGFVDWSGNEVIQCIYEDAEAGFVESLVKVKLNGKWGYINTLGKTIIPLKFDELKNFKDGLAKANLNGKWIYIDFAGREVPA